MSAIYAQIDSDFTEWKDVFMRLAVVQKKTLPEILVDSARELAKTLAYQTQPFGMGLEAKKQGEAAIARDIKRVYITPKDGYEFIKRKSVPAAKAFYKYVINGDFEKAQTLAARIGLTLKDIKPLDDGTYHRSQRNSRGRVNRNTQPMMVQNKASLNKYIKQVQRDVGKAKAGWASAATDLGKARGIPAWIKRHAVKSGQGTIDFSDPIFSVTIESRVKYALEVLSPGQVKEALRISKEKMLKRIEYILTAREKNATKS